MEKQFRKDVYKRQPCEYALFDTPRQIILTAENDLFLADSNNHVIRKITQDGVVSTVIGQAGMTGNQDGTPEVALFNEPFGVAVDTDGTIYIGCLLYTSRDRYAYFLL